MTKTEMSTTKDEQTINSVKSLIYNHNNAMMKKLERNEPVPAHYKTDKFKCGIKVDALSSIGEDIILNQLQDLTHAIDETIQKCNDPRQVKFVSNDIKCDGSWVINDIVYNISHNEQQSKL